MPLFRRNRIAQAHEFTQIDKPFFTSQVPCTYIQIMGVGSDTKSFSSTWKSEDKKIDVVSSPYRSNGVLSNVVDVVKDMKTVKNAASKGYAPKFPVSASGMFSFDYSNSTFRHRALYQIVRSQLQKPDTKPVVIIAISHGSIIAHATILRLMMDLSITRDQLNKLKVVTLGSPQYIPPDLLSRPQQGGTLPPLPGRQPHQRQPQHVNAIVDNIPRILNIYNVEDHIVFKSFIVKHFLMRLRVPDATLLESVKRTISSSLGFQTSPLSHVFLKDCGLIFTQFNTPMKQIIATAYSMPIKDADYLCHSASDNLNVIVDHIERNTQIYGLTLSEFLFVNYAPIERTRDEVHVRVGGGSSREVTIMSTKKKYKVRLDADKRKYIMMNKQKTYLKDIRGKFRYL